LFIRKSKFENRKYYFLFVFTDACINPSACSGTKPSLRSRNPALAQRQGEMLSSP